MGFVGKGSKFSMVRNNKPAASRSNFDRFFISGLYGLIVLKVFLSFFLRVPAVHRDDLKLYLWGWVLSLVAGLSLGSLLETMRKKWFGSDGRFNPLFQLLNFVILLILFHPTEWEVSSGPIELGAFVIVQ